MKLRELLAYAVKAKASEIQVAMNAPMKIRIGPNMKQVNMPPLNAGEFKELVIDHLSPAAKEELKANGKCDTNIDIEGLGRFRAIVEGQRARLLMPTTTRGASSRVAPAAPPVQAAPDDGLAPGQVPTFGQRLRAFFGKK